MDRILHFALRYVHRALHSVSCIIERCEREAPPKVDAHIISLRHYKETIDAATRDRARKRRSDGGNCSGDSWNDWCLPRSISANRRIEWD